MKVLKNYWWLALNVVVLLVFGSALAAAPSAPGVQDVLAIPFGTLFAQAASLTAALNLLGMGLRHWLKLEGLTLFSSIIVAGVVLGVIGQYANILTAPDFMTIAAPWGGIAFGFQAGLTAVGVNQGKRQITGTSPAKEKNSDLPRSG